MNSFLEMIPALVAFLGVGVVVFVLIPYTKKRNIARMEQAGQQIAGVGNYVLEDPPSNLFCCNLGKVLRIKRPQRDIVIVDHEGSKNVPAYTVLSVELPVMTSFAFSREGILNRLGKQLSLAREIEIGRKDLDDAFFLSVGDEMHGRNLLAHSEMIHALVQLLEFTNFERLTGQPTSSKSYDLKQFGFEEGLTLRLHGSLAKQPGPKLVQALEILESVAEAVRKTG